MAQQKDYKVLVVQKVMVPYFAFHKNIGWGIFDHNFFRGVWEFQQTNFQKFKCPEQRSVQEGGGGCAGRKVLKFQIVWSN